MMYLVGRALFLCCTLESSCRVYELVNVLVLQCALFMKIGNEHIKQKKKMRENIKNTVKVEIFARLIFRAQPRKMNIACF